jgi:hypothetical protein
VVAPLPLAKDRSSRVIRTATRAASAAAKFPCNREITAIFSIPIANSLNIPAG